MWSVDYLLSSFARCSLVTFVSLATFSLVAACSITSPVETTVGSAAAVASADESPLRPGDAVRVSFSREPDQSGTYQVDATGNVALPFIGQYDVTSTSPDSLRLELLSAYDGQLRNQTISVELLRRVRVLGAVKEPGLYHVDGTMTVADVIAQAGGATENGRLEDVRVVRDNQVIYANVEVDAGAFRYLGSGDQVLLPEKSWLAKHSGLLVGSIITAFGWAL
jgi:polysaccharide export outer membrane protein